MDLYDHPEKQYKVEQEVVDKEIHFIDVMPIETIEDKKDKQFMLMCCAIICALFFICCVVGVILIFMSIFFPVYFKRS